MKTINTLFRRTKLFVLFLLGIFNFSNAQETTNWSGNWDGAIEIPGTKLEINIALKATDEGWTGDLDIPIQMVKDMALEDLKIEGDKISFKLPEVPGNASFEGHINEESNEISGDFSQGGGSFPMNLMKEDAAQAAAKAAQLAEAIEKIESLADSLLKETKVPGLGLGIVKDGKVVMAKGFGFKNLETKEAVTPNTQFAIGSSSKAFTTMGLGMLSNDGLLDWNEPILTYMPDFQLMDDFATEEMNATDLTTHRSGLPRHDLMWYGSSFSREELYNRMKYLEPNEPFRTEWQYQNLMYMTAGILIERISEQSWEDFTRTRIFEPLGMNNSNFSVDEMAQNADHALPYSKKEEEVSKMDFRNINAIGPAGSINSSVNDMLKWVQFHLDLGKVGEEELIDKLEVTRMHSPHIVINNGAPSSSPELTEAMYGLAWMVYDYNGVRVVEHGGNIDGFSAKVYFLPKENIGMVLLTNLNANGVPTILARSATDYLLDREGTDWFEKAFGKKENEEEEEEEEEKEEEEARIENTAPHHDLETYVATYQHPGYGNIDITYEEKELRASLNSFNLTLEHWHFETFHGKEETLGIDLPITFYTDKDGKIDKISVPLDASVDDIVFERLPQNNADDPAYIAKLLGEYDLSGTTCNVSLKGQKLFVTIPGQPPYELEPYEGHEFKLKVLNGYKVKFLFGDKDEQVEELKFIQPNGIFTAKRI